MTRIATLTLLAALTLAAGARAQAATISTVVGTGAGGFSGDNGPAAMARINDPRAVAYAADGSLLVADYANQRVRRVAPDGTITTVAGTGVAGFSGDDGPATQAQLNEPRGLGVTSDGGFLIADKSNNRVRKVGPDGIIRTIAGNGTRSFSGDDGPATAAALNDPYQAVEAPDGSILIADRDNRRIRRVAPDGTITTVAGNGSGGASGDGGPAVAAELNAPCSITFMPDGSYLVPDRDNHEVRRIGSDGIITTVAGSGVGGFGGDGGPATQAQMTEPYAVERTPDGGFVVAERGGNRVRRVFPDGRIFTVAGTGSSGYTGDGGPAVDATLNTPLGLAVTPGGELLIADSGNDAIRRVSGFDAEPQPLGAPAPAPSPAATAPAPAPIASGPPRGIAVRLSFVRARLRVRTRRTLVVRARASRAGVPLTLAVRRGRVTVATATATARRGVTRLVVRRRLRPGRYVLVLGAPGAVPVRAALTVRR